MESKILFLNKNMKKLIVYVCCMLALCACKNTTPNATYLIDIEKIPTQSDEYLSSIISDLKLIPLETNDSCLIGEVDVIKKRNGRYCVQSGRNVLHIFDEQGHFINRIGQQGSGPGEYELLSDFEADKHYVYLLSHHKLLVYDWEGNFQKEIPLSINVRTIRKIKGGFLAQVNGAIGEDGLAFLNEEGKVLQTEMPKNEHLRMVRAIPWVNLKEGISIFQLSYTNDMYGFDTEQNKFFELSVTNDKDALTFDQLLAMGNQKLNLQQTSKLIFDGFSASRSQLVLGGMKDGKMYLYLYRKENQQPYRLDTNQVTDDVTFTQWQFCRNMGKCDSDDDFLFTYMEANVLQEAAERGGVLNQTPYVTLKDLRDESNPVIIAYSF